MRLSTPAAILIAGAMIALATYLGLSRRSSMIGVTVAGASAPIPLATAGVRDVEAEVRTALEGYRSKLRDRCLGDAATDPSYEGSWTFNYTFAPDGSQIIRGVIEHGPDASARPSVTRCVLDALPPLRIPPPNATVRVDVAFSLP